MAYLANSFNTRVVELLKRGGIGFMPTDTIYGLSAVASSQSSVERIYRLKGRYNNKPFVILLSSAQQSADIGINPKELETVSNFWPAPISFICAAPKSLWHLHRGTKSLACRIPADKAIAKLILEVGPIVSTSANMHGENPARSVKEAIALFGDKLDFYVDAGTLSGRPSTIARITNGKLDIVRQGAWQIPL